jgi:hypothetical protein
VNKSATKSRHFHDDSAVACSYCERTLRRTWEHRNQRRSCRSMPSPRCVCGMQIAACITRRLQRGVSVRDAHARQVQPSHGCACTISKATARLLKTREPMLPMMVAATRTRIALLDAQARRGETLQVTMNHTQGNRYVGFDVAASPTLRRRVGGASHVGPNPVGRQHLEPGRTQTGPWRVGAD